MRFVPMLTKLVETASPQLLTVFFRFDKLDLAF